jgi:hypothetical protein
MRSRSVVEMVAAMQPERWRADCGAVTLYKYRNEVNTNPPRIDAAGIM